MVGRAGQEEGGGHSLIACGGQGGEHKGGTFPRWRTKTSRNELQLLVVGWYVNTKSLYIQEILCKNNLRPLCM